MWPITVTFSYCIRVQLTLIYTMGVSLFTQYSLLSKTILYGRPNRGVGVGLAVRGIYYIYVCSKTIPSPPHITFMRSGDITEEGGRWGSPPPLLTYKGTADMVLYTPKGTHTLTSEHCWAYFFIAMPTIHNTTLFKTLPPRYFHIKGGWPRTGSFMLFTHTYTFEN